ncbi:MAG: FG-GAP-like repeat-containing protein [Fibrobacterota bacterium]|nr:FG-GAP-like repeat-containing protein [Fibrobacterota bacterium]
MKKLKSTLTLITILVSSVYLHAQTRLTAGPIQFDLIEVDSKFTSEGIGVGDMDKDGDSDLFVGDYWYESPGKSYVGTWIKHEMRQPQADGNLDIHSYSQCHGAFMGDFNNDGYPDPLIVPIHGGEPTWYENPKGLKTNKRWTAHTLGYHYGMEQSWWGSIDGSGKKSLVTSNVADYSWSYWTPDASGKFLETKISGPNAPKTGNNDHGMGLSDVNGDGRPDLIIQVGWYENPGSTTLWKYHPVLFRDHSEFSHIWTYDFNKDGRLDLITASSHDKGIWLISQTAPDVWKDSTINNSYKTNHALVMADLDLDGIPDVISGKRMWAHSGPEDGVDVGLYWIKVTPGATPKFDLHFIKPQNAGVGTQFEVMDINGDKFPDIVVSNKTGTKMYLQVPRGNVAISTLQSASTPGHNRSLKLTSDGVMAVSPFWDSRILNSLDGKRLPLINPPLP